MPRISESQSLSLDAIDALLHLTIRTFYGTSEGTLLLLIELSDLIDQEVAELKNNEEKLFLTHYSLCFFQLEIMASKTGEATEFNELIDTLSVKYDLISEGYTDNLNTINLHNKIYLAAQARALLETSMSRRGIDIKMAEKISKTLYAKYANVIIQLSDHEIIDLSIRTLIISNPYTLLSFISFLSEHEFIACKQVSGISERSSHFGALIIALYREFNIAIGIGLSLFYKALILEESKIQLHNNDKHSELRFERITFELSETQFGPLKEVLRGFVENGEYNPRFQPFPACADSENKDSILSLIKYGTECLNYKSFQRDGKKLRIDKALSMIGGAYMHLGADYLLPNTEHLRAIYDPSQGRFNGDKESDNLASRTSQSLRKFGIRVGPHSIYKEFVYGKRRVYQSIPTTWKHRYKNSLLEPLSIYFDQLVSGTFEYMLYPNCDDGNSGGDTEL